jgi:hypothetical protein
LLLEANTRTPEDKQVHTSQRGTPLTGAISETDAKDLILHRIGQLSPDKYFDRSSVDIRRTPGRERAWTAKIAGADVQLETDLMNWVHEYRLELKDDHPGDG